MLKTGIGGGDVLLARAGNELGDFRRELIAAGFRLGDFFGARAGGESIEISTFCLEKLGGFGTSLAQVEAGF